MILNSANFIAIYANAIFCVWLLMLLPKLNKINGWQRLLVIAVLILGVDLIPVYHGLCLVKIMRGIVGDLSITTAILLTYSIVISVNARAWGTGIHNLINPYFANIIVILGLILYLSTFAIAKIDIYAFGYFPTYILIGFISIELYLWCSSRVCAWIWIIALVAFYFKLQSSVNFWDYLFDPVLWFIAVVRSIITVIPNINQKVYV